MAASRPNCARIQRPPFTPYPNRAKSPFSGSSGTTSDKAAATMIDEEGNGWLIMSLDIPDDKYAQGYTYYGLQFYNTSRTINYEYFSWSLSPADLEKFMEYFE